MSQEPASEVKNLRHGGRNNCLWTCVAYLKDDWIAVHQYLVLVPTKKQKSFLSDVSTET